MDCLLERAVISVCRKYIHQSGSTIQCMGEVKQTLQDDKCLLVAIEGLQLDKSRVEKTCKQHKHALKYFYTLFVKILSAYTL
jgi:hypothetical protein